MRILVLTNLYPNPFHPNRATYNRQQLRELARNHPVAVISPISWVDELTARWKGSRPLPQARRVLCDGIPVDHPRYLYPPKVMRTWYGHLFRRSVRASFERACSEFHPDVVLGAWAYPDGWAAVRLARRAGLPVFIKVHGCDVLCGGAGLKSDPGRQRPTVEALRQATGVIAVSRHLADTVIELGVAPRRVHVVYDGIDPTLFHPDSVTDPRPSFGLTPGSRLILFVGNLVPVKGIETLVDACGRLAQGGTEFTACLIGQGPLRANLEQQVRRLGLEQRVQLLGPQPHSQLADWYRAASVFVLPSYSEGVPSVLLEAAACGTPFVASRVGGIPEIAHLGPSELVPPGDSLRLAEALKTFLTTPAPSRTARPASTRTWADSAEDLSEVFATALGTCRGKGLVSSCAYGGPA